MGRFVRRLLRPDPGREPRDTSQPSGAEATVARLQSYHVERSSEMEREQHGDPTGAARPEAAQRGGFGDVGERVSAILQSAQEAADDIRKQAEEQAERVRQTAERDAAASSQAAERRLEEQRRELEQLRPEAERYGEEVRKAADAYAEEKRREAEQNAARVRKEAEEAARKIEEEAVGHRKALIDESEALQTWLDQAVTAFKEVTRRLETVAGSRPQPPGEPRSEEEAPSLEEAVQPRGEYAKTK